ncbi:MAG: hypothetical protein C4523_03875 [Myxococcales bacterium]|nr:MAG: hypothetical protein C4523_03875 [Myxococcales bacterium]
MERIRVTGLAALAVLFLVLAACSESTTTTGGSDADGDAADSDVTLDGELPDGDGAGDGDKDTPETCAGECHASDQPFCLEDRVCVCEAGVWTLYDCETICAAQDQTAWGCGPNEERGFDYCICLEADGDEDAAEPEQETEPEAEPEEDEPVTWVEGYRVNALEISSPEMFIAGVNYDVKQELNNRIAQAVADDQLNLIFEPLTNDLLNFPYEYQFSMAEKQGDEYIVNDENAYFIEVVADEESGNLRRFTSEEGVEFTLPIDPQNGLVLPLRDVILKGTYSEDFGQVENGILAGAMSQTDAQNTIVWSNYSLADIFQLLGVVTDYTFEDGSKGYTFIFFYTAAEAYIGRP